MLAVTIWCFILSNIEFVKGAAVGSLDLELYHENLLMISDIQKHYKFTSVFIIHTNDETLRTETMIMNLSQEFSKRFVRSRILSFDDSERCRSEYYDHIDQPLFVAMISSVLEVMEFQRLLSASNMRDTQWLVIFTKPLPEFCPTPAQNYFSLRFDTEMIVKCPEDPVIYEWYSFHGTDIVVQDFARWDMDNRYQVKSDKSLYERRKNLKGKLIRVVTVRSRNYLYMRQPDGSALQWSAYFRVRCGAIAEAIEVKTYHSYREKSSTGRFLGTRALPLRSRRHFPA
ncbi:hypothetical protein QAD02_014788 [Eretmocerus hayati]|uniref:Uncharacterized protein n=1 Tax=Eretmocerus hayati TaxID=131215 RepID=A0ACC2P807_9HYME|nr:hypothetical protein QAD02_014788 [Eretmocerus hayati]